jgi:hypothetical protein
MIEFEKQYCKGYNISDDNAASHAGNVVAAQHVH